MAFRGETVAVDHGGVVWEMKYSRFGVAGLEQYSVLTWIYRCIISRYILEVLE